LSRKGKLLRGARPIAGHLFGDQDEFKSIYRLVVPLGLFKLGGMISGYEGSIDKRMADLERAGLKRQRRKTRMEAG
jgi:hypothetical protein